MLPEPYLILHYTQRKVDHHLIQSEYCKKLIKYIYYNTKTNIYINILIFILNIYIKIKKNIIKYILYRNAEISVAQHDRPSNPCKYEDKVPLLNDAISASSCSV